jgi:hypothetical protein
MNHIPFSFRRLNLDQGSLELTEEYIRLRAYHIYEERGRQDGHDQEDWYQAESEILGKKPAISEPEVKAEEAEVEKSAA